jgi:hypothetical protein
MNCTKYQKGVATQKSFIRLIVNVSLIKIILELSILFIILKIVLIFKVIEITFEKISTLFLCLKKQLEIPGIEPGAFHMQSERATTALYPLHTKLMQKGERVIMNKISNSI